MNNNEPQQIIPDFDDLPSSFQDDESQAKVFKSDDQLSQIQVNEAAEVTHTVHINLGSSSVDGDQNDPANLDSSIESSPKRSDDRFQQLTDRRANNSDGRFGDVSALVKNREIPADSTGNMNDVSYNRLQSPMGVKCNKTAEYQMTNQSL